jgi:hypothetical protein
MPTSNIKTSTHKNYFNQWVVESTLLLNEAKRLELKVYTTKTSSGNLITNASVNVVSEDGLHTTHTLFTDYNRQLQSTKHKRVTLKIVEGQHKLVDWASIIQEAKLHYGI